MKTKLMRGRILKVYWNDMYQGTSRIWQGASGTIYFYHLCIEFRPLMKY